MTTVAVNELFVSLQGESSWQGYPCFFVRLAGCNLNCSYCDTPAARQPSATRMRIAAIVATCRSHDTPLIMITGGEPLAQEGFGDLALALGKLPSRTLLVETNGSHDISGIPERAITIMDIKCPGSGEADAMDPENLRRLRARDEVKFVLTDRADYAFALDTIQRFRLAERCRHILLAPAAGKLDPALLAQWLIEDRPPVRLQLQWHRLLGLR